MKTTLFVLAALLCCACSEPSGYEAFVRAEDASDGVYSFVFPVSDTLNVYDLSFYTRTDNLHALSRSARAPLEMNIRWFSPSSEGEQASLAETVYADGGSDCGRRFAYRSGVVVPEAGDWTLLVSLAGVPEGFCGLGLTISKNGTR